jgi:hypothetical protein
MTTVAVSAQLLVAREVSGWAAPIAANRSGMGLIGSEHTADTSIRMTNP